MEVFYLGNIRQLNIKNISKKLIQEYPNDFKKNDFQHNKKMVSEFTDVKSKRTRNRIAGYVTRLLSSRKKITNEEYI
jgi:small subunit ribosomal protein S17e